MGKMTLTPEYVRSQKRQTLVIKDIKTNKAKRKDSVLCLVVININILIANLELDILVTLVI